MPCRADAGGAVDVKANIALAASLGVAGMQPDAGRHADTLGPGMVGEGTLDLDGGLHRVDGAGKGDKEAVALRIDLTAVVRLKDRAQQHTVLSEHIAVAWPKALEQLRRALDVGEEQGDRAA